MYNIMATCVHTCNYMWLQGRSLHTTRVKCTLQCLYIVVELLYLYIKQDMKMSEDDVIMLPTNWD